MEEWLEELIARKKKIHQTLGYDSKTDEQLKKDIIEHIKNPSHKDSKLLDFGTNIFANLYNLDHLDDVERTIHIKVALPVKEFIVRLPDDNDEDAYIIMAKLRHKIFKDGQLLDILEELRQIKNDLVEWEEGDIFSMDLD